MEVVEIDVAFDDVLVVVTSAAFFGEEVDRFVDYTKDFCCKVSNQSKPIVVSNAVMLEFVIKEKSCLVKRLSTPKMYFLEKAQASTWKTNKW